MQTTKTGIPAASAVISRKSKIDSAPSPTSSEKALSYFKLEILISILSGSLLFLAGKYAGVFDFPGIFSQIAAQGAGIAQIAPFTVFLCFFILALIYAGVRHGLRAPILVEMVLAALAMIYVFAGAISGAIAASLIFISAPIYYFGMLGLGESAIKANLGFVKSGIGKGILLGLGAYLFAIGISLVLGIALALAGVSDSQKIADKVAAFPLEVLVFAIIITPVAEEIFFRGFLQQKIGLIPSAMIFAAAHIAYFSVSEIAGALAIGLLLGVIFKYSKSIYAVIIAHALYNLTSILAIKLLF